MSSIKNLHFSKTITSKNLIDSKTNYFEKYKNNGFFFKFQIPGADINAQTEETQETALTLACCGGFLDVADFLIKAGADLELGASSPLMEAAQEGHLELVKYLLEARAEVNSQTSTGDTALSFACERGHTDVADLLLKWGSDLEHESEGGRTPLMKAVRAGHYCTAKFLIGKVCI